MKDLLKNIDVVNASSKVVDLVMDLGLLIDCVVADLGRIRETCNKIQTKSDTQTAEWEAGSESITRSTELEKTYENIKK